MMELSLVVVFTMIFVHLVNSSNEKCNVERQSDLGLTEYRPGAQSLRTDYDTMSDEECFQRCCTYTDYTGNHCNAASFYLLAEELPVCLLLSCVPFDSCVWSSDTSSIAAWVQQGFSEDAVQLPDTIDQGSMPNQTSQISGIPVWQAPQTNSSTQTSPSNDTSSFDQLPGDEALNSTPLGRPMVQDFNVVPPEMVDPALAEAGTPESAIKGTDLTEDTDTDNAWNVIDTESLSPDSGQPANSVDNNGQQQPGQPIEEDSNSDPSDNPNDDDDDAADDDDDDVDDDDDDDDDDYDDAFWDFIGAGKEKILDSSQSDPAISGPAISDPAISDPAISDPAISDPAISDPAFQGDSVAASDEKGFDGYSNTSVPAVDQPKQSLDQPEQSVLQPEQPFRDQPKQSVDVVTVSKDNQGDWQVETTPTQDQEYKEPRQVRRLMIQSPVLIIGLCSVLGLAFLVLAAIFRKIYKGQGTPKYKLLRDYDVRSEPPLLP